MAQIDIEVAFGGLGRKVQFWLRLDPDIQPDKFLLYHFQNGLCFEPEILWVLLHVLKEGDTAIDVGANIGFFTLMMSRLVGETGKVIACEPGTNNLPTLWHHLDVNHVENVDVVSQPLWSTVGPVTFYLNPDDRSSNAMWDPAQWEQNVEAKAYPQKLTLEATTIDTLVTGFVDRKKIKVIKIDTEGAEQRVLEGAHTLLATFPPPFIIAELNPLGLPQAGCSAETLRCLMSDYGYRMFFLHQNDLFPTLVPVTTKVTYVNDIQVMNVMFSTMERVSAAWPEAVG